MGWFCKEIQKKTGGFEVYLQYLFIWTRPEENQSHARSPWLSWAMSNASRRIHSFAVAMLHRHCEISFIEKRSKREVPSKFWPIATQMISHAFGLPDYRSQSLKSIVTLEDSPFSRTTHDPSSLASERTYICLVFSEPVVNRQSAAKEQSFQCGILSWAELDGSILTRSFWAKQTQKDSWSWTINSNDNV